MQVAVVAKQQGIDVPADITAQALVADMITGWKEGSDQDADRIYLKTKGFVLTDGAKPRVAKGLYLEVRALRGAITVLQAAVTIAEEKGYNTSPSEFARVDQTVTLNKNG